MRILEYTVGQEQAGRTVRSIALREMKLSRGMFSRLKFQHAILADGAPVRADARLREGQVLRICLADAGQPMIPCAVPFTIPWQDDDLFILDKPAPLPTLCSAHQSGPTLENAL